MEIENKYKNGFNKGYMQLRQCDVKKAKAEIMEAIGISNEVSFRYYRYGDIEPKAWQADRLAEVFSKYGISDIWGEYKNDDNPKSLGEILDKPEFDHLFRNKK